MKYVFSFLIIMLMAVSCQGETVQFTWTAPGDDGNIGTCAAYDLRYSEDSITQSNWNFCGLVPESMSMTPHEAGTPETLTVDIDLSSETTYYFAIKARDNESNWNGISNQVSIYIPDNIPPAIIVDFNAIKQ